MEIRSSQSHPTAANIKKHLINLEADQFERGRVIVALKDAIKEKPDEEMIDWSGSFISVRLDSSFDQVQKVTDVLLKDFLETQQVRAILAREGIQEHPSLVVTQDGRGNVDDVDLTAPFQSDAVVTTLLNDLAGAAKTMGGTASQDPLLTVPRWLAFHGMNVPQSVEQAKTLLFFLEWNWPQTDQLGNYWELLAGHDNDSVVLKISEYAEIRSLTARFVPAGETLLDVLYKNSPQASRFVDWVNAGEVLANILTSEFATRLARQYVDALQWFGASEGESTGAVELAQLLSTALILDLDPSFGKTDKRNHVGAHDLFAPQVAADKTMDIVRDGLEKYLVDNRRVSYRLCPLASHVLLAFLAPGFLVKDLPYGLFTGSIGWVTFCQAVAFIETNAKGASRFMTYEQVMNFANMDVIADEFGQLQGLVAIDSMIDWALINEVITHETLALSAKDAGEQALAAYREYVESIALGSTVFRQPLPSRKKIALDALEKAIPGADFLEKRLLRHYSDRLSHSYKLSMLEVHIEGELTSEDWDWREDERLYDRYPQLTGLPAVRDTFEAQVREHHDKLHQSLATNIKLAMTSMPKKHRDVFEKSEITFFTVRSSVSEQKFGKDIGYVGSGATTPVWMETQANRDAATGRYGIVLCALAPDNQFICYEVFYLRGECRINNPLGDLIYRGGKMLTPSRLDFKGSLTEYLPAERSARYPLDLKSYTNGTAPAPAMHSDVVIDRLGTLAAPRSLPPARLSIFQHFMHPHVEAIARFAITHHPVATLEELIQASTQLTERESKNADLQKAVDFVVDLVVPFKQCIEDIESGEKDRIEQGAWGCAMDAVGIIFAMLGATTKVLRLASKTLTLTARIRQGVSIGLAFTVEILNPIDGLPTAGYRVSKGVFKKGLFVAREFSDIFTDAAFQLRKLTGRARSVDLLKQARLPSLSHGTWRPYNGAIDALNVMAIQKGEHWYAVNRFGKAWGKKLAGFEFKRAFTFPGVRTLLPVGYSRKIIDKSLPIARRKIDHALSAWVAPSFDEEVDLVCKLFLGDKHNAREVMGTVLQLSKLDILKTSHLQYYFSVYGLEQHVFELNKPRYKAWGELAGDEAIKMQYIQVNHLNFVERFHSADLRYGDIADDLLHEFFRAAPNRLDRVRATTVPGKPGLNVAPLLNLALGRLPRETQAQTAFDRQSALENADSCVLVTALLSQLVNNKYAFERNIAIVTAAVENSAGAHIDQEVVIDLNDVTPGSHAS
ncbi:hypothetical protein [Pseudomonas sp.]|jgi:hypothetical protein|uniref:hypothetical protein n=1 Tax=Pseudomonas sp. TaxID=306 RepID=UPI002E2FB44C|nr:hypothetical protein [Pseudomonas sp.]HEX4550603.1 hypothetical protein [Pseudomonas sp.]